MYYLFLHQDKDLQKYKETFDKVSNQITNGVTPVFNEVASARTNLIETVPYNLLNGLMLILSTILLNRVEMNELIKIAIVLIANSLCSCIANYVFVKIKHGLRLKLCDRLNVPRDEHSIAVMESLEYQSVG